MEIEKKRSKATDIYNWICEQKHFFAIVNTFAKSIFSFEVVKLRFYRLKMFDSAIFFWIRCYFMKFMWWKWFSLIIFDVLLFIKRFWDRLCNEFFNSNRLIYIWNFTRISFINSFEKHMRCRCVSDSNLINSDQFAFTMN